MVHLRNCPFCRMRTGVMRHDDDNLRAYECAICLAVEKITKTQNQWWYHGWQALDEDETPGNRHDGDGREYPAPILFHQWVKDIPAGALSD